MADKVSFELVSPEKLILSQDVDMVEVPGDEGDFGILPGHALFISTLRPGVIKVHDGGQINSRIFVGGGFAEANPQGCTVLAEDAIPVDDIKRGEVEARIKDLSEDVADATNEFDKKAAEKALNVAQAMLAAAP